MNITRARTPRLAILLACSFALLPAGCGKAPEASNKVKVGYIGLTCEAPLFVAHEKGFYAEEGLDVELVKTDWDGLQSGLGLGRFDANHTLIMYLLKPIEQGMDVKITAGVHKGCLRVQAGVKTGLKSVADLKGKKIGVPVMGSPPFLLTSRALAAAGMDPAKDVTWVTVGGEVMELALENGQVDAVANSEPIGSILLGREKVRTILDQSLDAPYKDEYCCVTVVNGPFAARNPAGAAKVTRAILKAARWVQDNPTAAANLSVEKKYIASSPEINALAISKLEYLPGVAEGRTSVLVAARGMKQAGLLNPATDPEELAKRAWLDLDGVTDEWVKGLKVEKVAGGGRPAPLSRADFASMLDLGKSCRSCCSGAQ